MQNCEAFAEAGCDVTLWVARPLEHARDARSRRCHIHTTGCAPTSQVRRVPCLDIFPLFPADSAGARIAFYILQLSYALACLLLLLITRADIYYSRDEFVLSLLSRLRAKSSLAYEAHQFPQSGRGAALQRYAVAKVGSVIANHAAASSGSHPQARRRPRADHRCA